jgi:hypothetical protein
MIEALTELRAYLANRRGLAGDAEFGDMSAATRDYARFSRWLTALDDVVADSAHTVRVCDWCYAPVGSAAKHRVAVPDGPESMDIVCLWPCGHDVGSRERECWSCRDTTQDPF